MTRPKTSQPPKAAPAESWHERAAPPSVLELDTESAWAEFNAIDARLNKHFAATQPASCFPDSMPLDEAGFAPAAALAGLARAGQGALTVEDVMLVARQNNRVCPLPTHWAKLYDLLPVRPADSAPPRPVGLGAWSTTSAMYKRLVLREHIQWAAAHGVLPQVSAFICGLDEQCWLHVSQEPRVP